MRLALILLASVLWAADVPKPEPPKPVVLTDSDKLIIRTLQLRAARMDAAKLQIAAEEKAVNEALAKIVAEWQTKGCVLRDDLTCEAVKVEGKK